jgi:hypothetical protein
MVDTSPVVEVEQIIQGVGNLIRGEDSIPVASFSLKRMKYDRATEWKFTAHVGGEHWEKWALFTAAGISPLRFEGRVDDENEITISHLDWNLRIRGRLEAEVREWSMGRKIVPFNPTSQSVHLQLSGTPLALAEIEYPILDWSGEIRGGGTKRLPILFDSVLGEVSFSRRYVYEHALVGGAKSTLQIPVTSFVLKLTSQSCFSDLDVLMEKLDSEIEDALRVISFLSRRHVRWFWTKVISVSDSQEGRNFDEAEWNRSIGRTEGREVRPLINPLRPPPDGLGKMIARFRDLPFKTAASSAIVYLIASQHSEHVESHLVNAFTALESLVSGWGEAHGTNHTLSSAHFKQLCKTLKVDVSAFATQSGLGPNTVREMLDKLPELRRRPIVDQVIDLLHELDVPWQDLWPEGADLRMGIKEAFGRRNRFVHAGQLSSVAQAHVDATRIHAIAERILFLLIGGELGWQDFRAYEHIQELELIESGQV